MKLYILCPANRVTGGVELAHQLCDALNNNTSIDAYMWYMDIDNLTSESVVVDQCAPEEYAEYNTRCARDFFEIDRTENIIVFPEAYTGFMELIDKAQKVLWWMSVDGYINATREEDLEYLAENVALHLYQSYYAMEYVNRKIPGAKGLYLSDYINDEYGKALDVSANRDDIALYNPKKGYENLKPLIKKTSWLKWVPLSGMSRNEVISTMEHAKIYVDFGSHPGKDRIPREAAANGCCVITNKKGSAAFFKDVPIPDKYKFENPESCLDDIDNLLKEICNSFCEHQKDFHEYREMIIGEKEKFFEDVLRFADIIGAENKADKLTAEDIEEKKQFDTFVVITPRDCERLLNLYKRLADSIGYGKVIFVGASEIKEVLKKEKGLSEQVGTIDENTIISFDDVHKCIEKRMENILAGRKLPRGITGWYYQQFLKMQYANLCNDEYYMVWDGDTIPCRKLNMFHQESGKPYMDLKHEYHAEYFETMSVILPGLRKLIERSFISEHMLIKAEIMRAMIKEIERNDAIPGTKFWEKIINAIPEDKIQRSAFSEFETYGTYVALRYPDVYKLREWHSFRQGGNFFKIETICDRDFDWLAKDFDAISFEKGHEVREDNANLFDNPYYQEKLTPKQMLQAAQLEFKDGYKEVWADDLDAAKANVSQGSFNQGDDVVPESRLKYLDKDTYKIYEKLGDGLMTSNADQAFLCYENAEYLCADETDVKEISGKKLNLLESGQVSVNKVAIVILSYNNTYFIQRCIESIYTNCNMDSVLLVIFDNGSTDGTQQWLAKWGDEHDEALIILNEENLGFSAGNNAACQYIPEGYDVFYLNNDTRMPANALFWLRMGLYESGDIGGVGAMQSYAVPEQMEEVTFSAPEQFVEYGARHNIWMDNPLEEQVRLCGFAMLLRRRVYDETGGFDEAFNPGFLEDDDLSFRVRKLGHKLVVCHNSYIYHAGSQSFGKRSDTSELFDAHRKVFVDKWGFDSTIQGAMSFNELEFTKSLAGKGYTKDSEFSLLHIGCGCGNMLGRIHYMYPKAKLYGVEENDSARGYAISCICVVHTVEELPISLEKIDIVAENLG